MAECCGGVPTMRMRVKQPGFLLAVMLPGVFVTAGAAIYGDSSSSPFELRSIRDAGLSPTALGSGGLPNDRHFSLTSPSSLGGDLRDIDARFDDLVHMKNPAVSSVECATALCTAHAPAYGASNPATFALPSLTGGSYEVQVTGVGNGKEGGSYATRISVARLPAAAWLLLSGLAGVAVLARRRGVDSSA